MEIHPRHHEMGMARWHNSRIPSPSLFFYDMIPVPCLYFFFDPPLTGLKMATLPFIFATAYFWLLHQYFSNISCLFTLSLATL